MFIDLKYSGYNRHGEQSSAGRFLILLQPDTYKSTKYPHYKTECGTCGRDRSAHDWREKVLIPVCEQHGVIARIRARVAAGREPNDNDFTEQFEAGCETCAKKRAVISWLGCVYFKLQTIDYPIRAIVRYARLRQLGHFMMGRVKIGTHNVTLSGSYGSDGLPSTVPDEVYEHADTVELPSDLRQAWNNGGGWNSAGTEAGEMRQWALKTFSKK